MDISKESCDKFGFYFLDRIIVTSSSEPVKATGNYNFISIYIYIPVLGVGDNPEDVVKAMKYGNRVHKVMWVQLDSDKCASYWKEGLNHDSLVNKVRCSKLDDSSIPGFLFSFSS